MTIEELLQPIGKERFFDEFKDKKILVIKSKKNIFKDHFSWIEFDRYLQGIRMGGHDRVPQLQVVLPQGGKWCKKKDKKQYTKAEIYDMWKSGCSFILTLSEFLNKTMWEQCREFERYYGVGQANIYCSSQANAKTFPIHADSTDNFLFHVSGKIRWHIYKEWAPVSKKDKIASRTDNLTIDKEFDLDDGDLLYIPRHLYHRVTTLSPRISISFHFNELGESHKRYNRDPWLNWIPQGIYGSHTK